METKKTKDTQMPNTNGLHPVNPNCSMDIVFLTEARDCNPNGDAITGMPRIDEETNQGLISAECQGRLLRDYITAYAAAMQLLDKGYEVYYRHKGVLTTIRGDVFESLDKGVVQKPVVLGHNRAHQWTARVLVRVWLSGHTFSSVESGLSVWLLPHLS